MKYHPEFDGKLWFVPGTDAEARTVRELLKQLPPGSRIKDYYPKGYAAPVRVNTPRVDRPVPPLPPPVRYVPAQREDPVRSEPLAAAPASEPVPIQVIRGIERSKWTDANIALAIKWADQGADAREIGMHLGFSKNAVVGKLYRVRARMARERT